MEEWEQEYVAMGIAASVGTANCGKADASGRFRILRWARQMTTLSFEQTPAPSLSKTQALVTA